MGGGNLWGNPPPTRAIERLLRGGGNRPMGEPAPNTGYCWAIEMLPSYL